MNAGASNSTVGEPLFTPWLKYVNTEAGLAALRTLAKTYRTSSISC